MYFIDIKESNLVFDILKLKQLYNLVDFKYYLQQYKINTIMFSREELVEFIKNINKKTYIYTLKYITVSRSEEDY